MGCFEGPLAESGPSCGGTIAAPSAPATSACVAPDRSCRSSALLVFERALRRHQPLQPVLHYFFARALGCRGKPFPYLRHPHRMGNAWALSFDLDLTRWSGQAMMLRERRDGERYSFVECFRLHVHRMAHALEVGARDAAGANWHEEILSDSPFLRLLCISRFMPGTDPHPPDQNAT
jgi:hypothetical protein